MDKAKPKDYLYAALDVKSDADKAAIRKAYKKVAMKSHPDMPQGSPKKFALIKRAHDILTDDERRAKYDATGDDSEVSPDNAFSGAINCVAFALNTILAECAQHGTSPLEKDMIAAMRMKINANVTELEKQLRIHRTVLEIDSKLKDRFRRKNKFDGMGIMGSVLDHRIKSIRAQMASWENGIRDAKSALEMLVDWSFKSDSPDPSEARGGIQFVQMGRW